MIKQYVSQKSSEFSFLVISGAMQVRYDQFHPLVEYISENWGTVYSLGLPGHGDESDFINKSPDQSLNAAVDLMYYYIDNYVPKDNLIIISYSIGSLITIKLLSRMLHRNESVKLILIGSGLRIRNESTKLITGFFNEKTYLKLGWEDLMIRQHGKDWVKTVKLIDSWMHPSSGISPNKEELEILKENKSNIIWIIAENDQPFKTSDVKGISKDFEVRTVNYDHFSYFLKKKAWPEVKQIIEEKISEWCV
jgi:hypothetical protein